MTIEESIKQIRDDQAEEEKTATFRGYIVADLRKLFDHLTGNLKNWKDPFTVPGLLGEEIMPVVAAIGYFTGDGDPDVVLNVETMRYTVMTVGYYVATGEC